MPRRGRWFNRQLSNISRASTSPQPATSLRRRPEQRSWLESRIDPLPVRLPAAHGSGTPTPLDPGSPLILAILALFPKPDWTVLPHGDSPIYCSV